ncbi:JAB domain-containing protein [Bacillus sp. MUM 13]|nr:JAB domain-containing protein [Bacillus sp. MUM 13]
MLTNAASTPSKENIEVTKRLAAAWWIFGIDVLDHVIVSHTGKHVSLKGL